MAKIRDCMLTEANWRKDKFGTCSDCMCLVGWIFHCYEDIAIKGVIRKVLRSMSALDEPPPSENWAVLLLWNDDPKRTFAEVRDLVVKLDI